MTNLPKRSLDRSFRSLTSDRDAIRTNGETIGARRISNDANLLNLQKQVEDFVREARHRDPSEPNELVSTVVDTVARDYFRHAILKQRRLASLKGAGS